MPDRVDAARGRPVLLVLRRAGTQAALLGSVAAVVLVGAMVLGLCALLLTTARDHAMAAAVRAASPDSVDVRVAVRLAEGATAAADAAQAASDVAATAGAPYARFPTTVSTWAASTPLHLPAVPGAGVRRTYLLEGDDLREHADLVTGRWPSASATGGLEVVVLDVAADLLALSDGSTLLLSHEPQRVGVVPADAVEVTVVGTFAPRRGAQETWDRDPLDGDGYTPSFDGPPLYGPLVVAPGELLDRQPVERLSIVVRPDLRSIDPSTAVSTRAGVAGLRSALEESLGPRLRAMALDAPYPRTLDEIRNQQGVVGSAVLLAALLAAALATAALGLAGTLVVARRAAETDLLAARGATGRRLARHAVVEALVLAGVVTAVGIPLTLAVFRAVARLPGLAAAQIPPVAAPTTPLVVTVGTAALVLAAMLVAPTLRATRPGGRRGRADRRGLVARAGVDLVLVGLAVLGFLQLRAHGLATGAAPDPVLVAAPVLCLVAGATVMLRVLPWVTKVAERRAAGSRRLVVPLAAWELARRRHSTTGAFLVVLAAATAVFGLAFQATWSRSQVDQADAQVGADLVVTPDGAPALAHGAALATVTGGTPAAVTHRPVALGSRVGGDATGAATRLVAVDLAGAGLAVGRAPDGTTWRDMTADLRVVEPVAGPVLAPGRSVRLQVTGSAEDPMPLLATPSLVLQDPFGDQAVVVGETIPLDGRPHDLELELAGRADDLPLADGLRVVAVRMALALGEGAAPTTAIDQTTRVSIRTEVSGAVPGQGSDQWTGVRRDSGWQVIRTVETTQSGTADGVVIASIATVSLTGLLWETGNVVVIAGEPVTELPVVLTEGLAADLGLGVGGRMSVTVGLSTLDAHVVGVVPYVPSAATGPAVLVDRPSMVRALLGGGDLAPLTDQWWVHDPADPGAAAAAVTQAALGSPVTAVGVATHLRDGPLPSVLRSATWVLVVAAGLLALAGTAAHTAAAVGARAVEVARLLGMGVSRRAVLGSLLVQHAALCLVTVVAGAVVGAAVAWATAPLLVVSATGARPVPDALVVWPATGLGAALAVLFLGSTLVVVPVAAGAVRRARAAHLRMDVAP